MGYIVGLHSGKRLHNYGKSPFLMGKSMNINYFDWAIFNSFLYVYQRVYGISQLLVYPRYGHV